MKFILEVRRVESCDLGRGIPFLPEDDEYEMYLDALHEEISSIEGLSMVNRGNLTFAMETLGPMSVLRLKDLIKTTFTQSQLMKIQFVSVVEA